MAEEVYRGPEEAWGVIWRAVGAAMMSPAFLEGAREEIRVAREAILEATKGNTAGPINKATAAPVTGQLTFQQIGTGTQYRFNTNTLYNKYGNLHGKLCTVNKKARSRITVTLDEDAFGFKKGNSLTVYPQHLMPV